MNLSLTLSTRARHILAVTDPSDTITEMRLLGQALAYLRESLNLSQEEAGKRARPTLTRQAWQVHEAGRIKGILTPDVQRRLVAALGASLEDLRLAREKIAMHGEEARTAARAVGLRERAARAYEAPASSTRQAVFPLSAGEAVVSFPETLTVEDIENLEAFLTTFLRSAKSRVTN